VFLLREEYQRQGELVKTVIIRNLMRRNLVKTYMHIRGAYQSKIPISYRQNLMSRFFVVNKNLLGNLTVFMMHTHIWESDKLVFYRSVSSRTSLVLV